MDVEAALAVRMSLFKKEEETGTLLYYASKGNVPILKHMLDNGTSVDVADYDGRTALHLAASEGHTAAVELLLEYGPRLNPCDRFNETVSTLKHSFLLIDAFSVRKSCTFNQVKICAS